MDGENNVLMTVLVKYTDKDGEVGIEEVGTILSNIQKVIYDIAEMKESNGGFRRSGRRNSTLMKRSKLYLRDVRISSFEGAIAGPRRPVALEDFGQTSSLLEESVSSLSTVQKAIEDDNEEEVERELPNPYYRHRILDTLEKMCDKEKDEPFSVKFDYGNDKVRVLNAERKRVIKRMRGSRTDTDEIELIGTLLKGNFEEGSFVLRTTLGKNLKFNWPIDKRNDLLELAMKDAVVEMAAVVKLDDDDVTAIKEAKQVKELDNIQFKWAMDSLTEVELVKPVSAEIAFRDGEWWLLSPELGIIVSEKDFEEAYQSFQNDLAFLYRTYVKEDPKKLSASALEFREKLLNYFGG